MADYTLQLPGAEIDARLAKVPQLESSLAQKQDTLVSGGNIKTINGESIVGGGDIAVGDPNAVKYVSQSLTESQKEQARANIGAASLADIGDFDYVTATTLPTASASTMGHIYLIGPDANNNYDRYFTQESSGTYSWVSLGSTQIDLSDCATKEEVSQLEAEVTGNLMSTRAKNALLAVFQKVAFAVPDVSDEMDELETALFNLDEVVGVEATYTQGATVIWDQGVSTLDELREGLVVKAVYGDGTTAAVQNYTLSGTLTAGTSEITVTYQGFTDTFNVVVTLYGSKMSYVLNDGVAIARGFALTDSRYRIGAASTTRKHFFLRYGLHKMKNDDGAETQYYPLPIPKNATGVAVTITQSTMKIGGYFMKWDSENNEYVPMGISTQTFTAGGFTKTLDQDGTTQAYYVPGIAPASGNIPSGQPTAITIEFSTE